MAPPFHREPPTQAAPIREFLHRAGFFWRGGAVVAGSIFAGFLCFAFATSEVYQSEALIERGGALGQALDPVEMHAALTVESRLAIVVREVTPDLPTDGVRLTEALAIGRQSIDVRGREGGRLALGFRAPTAEAAQRGARKLSQLALDHLGEASKSAGAGPDSGSSSRAAQKLEERTRELAAFVAQHPEVALSPSSTPAAPASAASSARAAAAPSGSSDATLIVLQQQRANLEARIAAAERQAAKAEANPYDLPSDHVDSTALQRMLADVKTAIAARQGAVMRVRAVPSGAEEKGGAAPAVGPGSRALQAEWQRLVQAVVEAQREPAGQPPAVSTTALARIVREASLPSASLKPNRPLVILVGLAAGLWLGVLWAFGRVALGHDRAWRAELAPRPGSAPEKARDPLPAIPQAPEVPAGSTSPSAATASTQPALAAFLQDGLVSAGRSPPPPLGNRPPPKWPPAALRVTQKGVIDVAKVLAETGRLAESATPSLKPVPIVNVGEGGAEVLPTPAAARATSSHPPPRPPSDPPRRPPSDPPPTSDPLRGPPNTRTFGSPVPMKQSNEAPGGPSTALALAKPNTTYSMVHSEPPRDVIAPRDVPKGWSPDPSLQSSEAVEELRGLRDQLYQLARRGSFVVGVSSGPDAAAAKSRIAARLATMLAEPAEARVLLMEADFDRPSVHRLMRVDMPISSGFSQQMHRRISMRKSTPWTLLRCSPHLHVLAEGLVRSPGLLPSVPFGEAVSELRGCYDLIVADGPIAGRSIDTRALDSVADGLVFVVRAGVALPNELGRTSQWFGKKELMAVISVGT